MTKDDIIWGNEIESESNGWESYFMPDQVRKAMDLYAKQREEYWKQRCLAAEEYIEQSPCDPDITPKQIEAYVKWRQLVDNQFIEQQNKGND